MNTLLLPNFQVHQAFAPIQANFPAILPGESEQRGDNKVNIYTTLMCGVLAEADLQSVAGFCIRERAQKLA